MPIFFVIFMSCAFHLAGEPFPSQVVNDNEEMPPHFLSPIHVNKAKPCTQKNTCKSNNPCGLDAKRIWWKFAHRALPSNSILIMSSQRSV